MYVAKDTSDPRDLRIRVSAKLAGAIDAFCERKRISKQDLAEGLFWWLVKGDDTIASMILGQIDADDDLIETVLRRLPKGKERPDYGRLSGTSQKSVGRP